MDLEKNKFPNTVDNNRNITITAPNHAFSNGAMSSSNLNDVGTSSSKDDKHKINGLKGWIIGCLRFLGIVVLLYIFVCSLTFLTDAFRLLAGRSAGDVFSGNNVLHNPVVGLMIGVLFTVLVQSSSTCTSVIVSLVSSGVVDVKTAIPMVMGANIGTSMTSTLVSLTHMADPKQFERAFSSATVHDCFNWLGVISLLIIEVITGYLYHVTAFLTQNVPETSEGKKTNINLLKALTKPFTSKIIKLDKKVLECWSNPNKTGCAEKSAEDKLGRLLKVYCKHSGSNGSHTEDDYCHFLFNLPNVPDNVIGGILLVISLVLLTLCLLLIVKVLRSALEGSLASLLKKFINADVPYVPWLTGYIAIIIGAIMTFLVQSSSVFTSTLTPLVGVGLISVDRVYPLVLGSNIGTTATALIAGLAAGNRNSLQIALCHLIFNITAITFFYPIPFMRWPLGMCKVLGRTTAQYRWFAIFYLFVMFFIVPGVVMGLSIAGVAILFGILGPIAIISLVIILVNVLQAKKPQWLPGIFNNWDFLPFWMHSFEPMDKVIRRAGSACCCGCSERLQCSRDDSGDVETPNDWTNGTLKGRENYAMEIDYRHNA